MKLTDIFTVEDHQRMINRFNNMLLKNGHNPAKLTTEAINKKLDWHTQEFIRKGGNLND